MTPLTSGDQPRADSLSSGKVGCWASRYGWLSIRTEKEVPPSARYAARERGTWD